MREFIARSLNLTVCVLGECAAACTRASAFECKCEIVHCVRTASFCQSLGGSNAPQHGIRRPGFANDLETKGDGENMLSEKRSAKQWSRVSASAARSSPGIEATHVQKRRQRAAEHLDGAEAVRSLRPRDHQPDEAPHSAIVAVPVQLVHAIGYIARSHHDFAAIAIDEQHDNVAEACSEALDEPRAAVEGALRAKRNIETVRGNSLIVTCCTWNSAVHRISSPVENTTFFSPVTRPRSSSAALARRPKRNPFKSN